MTSIIELYSFLNNAKKLIKHHNEDFTQIHKEQTFQFKNAKQYALNALKCPYNSLESHIYTYRDILVYLLHKYALDGSIEVYKLDDNEILKTKKIFTEKQLKIDRDFITRINQTMKLKTIDEFFIVRDSGEPIVFTLLKQNYITSAFFVRFFLTTQNKDAIFKTTDYQRYEYSLKQIIKILKGALHGKEEV